ncbi:unannotated protein [freshwater metagenome]|uniref:Unannotated protein n=1 Tax=freshwater metagenome TaxID=449393 RepID=A0A6J6GQW8_9ZZZZ
MLDEALEHRDHGPALCKRFGTQVDALVVQGPEGGESFGEGLAHGDPTCRDRTLDHALDECAQPCAAPRSTAVEHDRRKIIEGDDAGMDGVFEIVTDIGDPVGPAHDLALGGGGGRARP